MRPNERALRFALGAMTRDERKELEQQREQDAELDADLSKAEEIFSPLALSRESAPVPADLWNRIDAELQQGIDDEPTIRTEMCHEGKWRRFNRKVDIKRLWDGSALLVRCEAGAVIRAHEHRAEERMVIISGTVHIGNLVLGPGDTQVAPAGTKHEEISSPTGCVFMVQMLDEAA